MLTDDLDVLLDRLGTRGALFHAFRVDRHGPNILAAVHDWGGAADVVILIDQDHSVAYRTPTGPGIDVFHPERVYWSYAAGPVWTLRAVLTLAPPGHPDAPTDLVPAPNGLGLPTKGASASPHPPVWPDLINPRLTIQPRSEPT